jgi:AraC-like DNA-binding protein
VAYREFAPPAPLGAAVECGWIARVGSAQAARVEPVLPDACMDLMWSGEALLVAGPDTTAHPVRRVPSTTYVGLRFRPGRLPALLQVPAAVLRDQRVPLSEVQPALARRALARIEAGEAPAAVLAGIATSLPGGEVDAGVPALVAHAAAGASVAATAEALGCTPRSVHRRSLDVFGYGPAVLRRVLRFRRALALLQGGVPPAEVAAVSGYADQPHLSREVRALSGMAPGQLVSGAYRSTPLPSGSRTVA